MGTSMPAAALTPRRRPPRAGGAALISALLTVALVAAIAAGLIAQQGLAVRTVGGRHDQAQARLLARGAVDWARNILGDDLLRTGNVDHFGEPWALRVPPIPVEEGEVSGEIEEQDGRFNLNNLVSGGVADPVQVATYRRLLGLAGIPDRDAVVLTATLVDWIDADAEPVAPYSAETPWYASLDRPYRSADTALVDLDELVRVKGYTAALIDRLRPLVTALPTRTRINVNTAPAEVLAAALPDLSLDDARVVVAARSRAWFKDIPDFQARLPRQNVGVPGERFAVESHYFVAAGRARYGVAVSALRVLLYRQSGWPDIIWQKIL